MSALACPASLKGVLSAVEAAAALAEGFARAGVDCEQVPVADGGEGTAEVLQRAVGGEWRVAAVSDAFGRRIRARWLLLADGTAVVEAAEAIGLSDVRDPLRASSRGLGELVLAAEGERLLVCLGGVATVDGGAGMLEVLRELPVPARVAYDVRTPLRDAARLYGPQKGASAADVAVLEARLAALEELAPFAEVEGSGAAGGLGAAFAALGAELVAGAQLVLETVRFPARLHGKQVAVTGEGTVDVTTFAGKAPGEVVRACAEAGIRCVLFGGRIVDGYEATSLSGEPARAREDLVLLGERVAVAAR